MKDSDSLLPPSTLERPDLGWIKLSSIVPPWVLGLVEAELDPSGEGMAVTSPSPGHD